MLLHKVSQVVAHQRDVNVSLHFAKLRDLLTAARIGGDPGKGLLLGAIRACGRGAKKSEMARPVRETGRRACPTFS